jgi:hypothetical protein
MVFRIFAPALLVLTLSVSVQAQVCDSRETLLWVQREATRIQSMLNDVSISGDLAELLLKMLQCQQDFELVALAGLYCHDARRAAEMGRLYCNPLNDRLPKDLNAVIMRAASARTMAQQMYSAAAACLLINERLPAGERYQITDLLTWEVNTIKEDLKSGLASNDVHQLALKLEHAIRILGDAVALSATLDDCTMVQQAALSAADFCTAALVSSEWGVAALQTQNALTALEGLNGKMNCK